MKSAIFFIFALVGHLTNGPSIFFPQLSRYDFESDPRRNHLDFVGETDGGTLPFGHFKKKTSGGSEPCQSPQAGDLKKRTDFDRQAVLVLRKQDIVRIGRNKPTLSKLCIFII